MRPVGRQNHVRLKLNQILRYRWGRKAQVDGLRLYDPELGETIMMEDNRDWSEVGDMFLAAV